MTTPLTVLFEDNAGGLFCPGCAECARARAAMEAWCSGGDAPSVHTDPQTGHSHLFDPKVR